MRYLSRLSSKSRSNLHVESSQFCLHSFRTKSQKCTFWPLSSLDRKSSLKSLRVHLCTNHRHKLWCLNFVMCPPNAGIHSWRGTISRKLATFAPLYQECRLGSTRHTPYRIAFQWSPSCFFCQWKASNPSFTALRASKDRWTFWSLDPPNASKSWWFQEIRAKSAQCRWERLWRPLCPRGTDFCTSREFCRKSDSRVDSLVRKLLSSFLLFCPWFAFF